MTGFLIGAFVGLRLISVTPAEQELKAANTPVAFQAWFDKHWDHRTPAEQKRLADQWIEQLKK